MFNLRITKIGICLDGLGKIAIGRRNIGDASFRVAGIRDWNGLCVSHDGIPQRPECPDLGTDAAHVRKVSLKKAFDVMPRSRILHFLV